MKTAKMFPDGVERKMTIVEFVSEYLQDDALMQIDGKSGTWVAGSARYCLAHLSKDRRGVCVQGVSNTDGVCVIRVR